MKVQVNICVQGTEFQTVLETLKAQTALETMKSESSFAKVTDYRKEHVVLVLIASLYADSKKSIVHMLEGVCHRLGEDFIDVKLENEPKGFVVFNPSYEGERFEFNESYFISL